MWNFARFMVDLAAALTCLLALEFIIMFSIGTATNILVFETDIPRTKKAFVSNLRTGFFVNFILGIGVLIYNRRNFGSDLRDRK